MIARHAVVILALVAFGPPTAASERAVTADSARELRICVDPANPPLSVNRVGGQPGLDVEIAHAVAEHLDLQPHLVWVDTTYGGRALRRSLLAGQCELFMGLPVDPAAETADALTLSALALRRSFRSGLVGHAQIRPRGH